MFNFLKKRKKNKNEEVVAQDQKNNGTENQFAPKFGSSQDFMDAYMKNGVHVVIGHDGENEVGVSIIDPPGDTMFVVNDNFDSVLNQCVAPTVLQEKLSYVIYDPEGKYSESLGTKMRLRGYDVMVVDFADPENKSRLDLFEIANITRNPYWLSVILSGSIKCEKNEIAIAHNLFMSAMQYLLAEKGKLTVEDFCDVCQKIVAIDVDVLRAVRECSTSKDYIEELAKYDMDILRAAYDKISNRLLAGMTLKAKNPNVFTVMAHKKQNVIFVRRVPKEYRYLMTVMLFNLKTSNVVCGYGDVSTLIIDTANEKWYNKAMLKKVTDEAGAIMDRSVGMMTIRGAIDDEAKANNNQILIYMHSDDVATREHVFGYLRVGGHQFTHTDTKEKGINVLEDAMNAAPIPFEELDKLTANIVIDTSGAVKPFMCDRLKVNG